MKNRSDPCSKAQKQYNKGDMKGSLLSISKCTKQLLKMMRESKDDRDKYKLQLANVYNFEGLIAMQINQLKKAKIAFNKSKLYLEHFPSSIANDKLLGEIFYSLGIVSIFQNEDAEPLLESSKAYFISSKEYKSAIKVMFQISDLKDEGNKKISIFKDIQKLTKKVKDKKDRRRLEGKARLFEGKVLNQQNMSGEAEILKAEKIFRKIKDEKGLIDVMIEKAILAEKSSLEKSEEILIEALDLAKITGLSSLMGNVLTSLGIISLKRGKFKKGKNRLLEGLKYRSEAGDKIGSAQTLLELSRITLVSARNDKDYKNAAKLIEQSLSLYKEVENSYGLAMAHEVASTVYTRLNEFGSAIKHAKIGRKIFHKHNDTLSEARLLAQLGVALDSNGDINEVIPVFEKSIKLFEDTNSPSGVAEVNYLLGLHLSKYDLKKSLIHLNNSLNLYELLKDEQKDMAMMYTIVSNKINEITD